MKRFFLITSLIFVASAVYAPRAFAYTTTFVNGSLTFNTPNVVDFFWTAQTPDITVWNDMYANGAPATLADYHEQIANQTLAFCSYGGFDQDGWWSAARIVDESYEEINYWQCQSGSVVGSTRFVQILPVGGSVVSTTTDIGATLFVLPADYRTGMYLSMSFTNQTVSLLGGSALDAWNSASGQGQEIRIPLGSGFNDVSTTTTFITAGKNRGVYKIVSPTLVSSIPVLGVLFSPSVLISSSTQFFVGYETPLDAAVELGGSSLNQFILTGTTTGANTITNCGSITTTGIVPCLISLVVPSEETLVDDITRLRNGFLSAWPLGYITRIVTIFTASTTASLPVLSATVPSGVVGAGAHISLDLNHSLDYILYSNVGSFANESASSTETFYEITSRYWEILIYLAVAFYIMRRVLGSHIIPAFHPSPKKEIT